MSDHTHSIGEALARRMEQLAGRDVEDDDRDDWSPWDEVLGVDTRAVHDVMLGVGGPTQFFRIWSADGEVSRVEFHDSWSNGPTVIVLAPREEADVLDALAWPDLFG